ncbi:MAG: DUF2974 domain-containing protein [Candidatus Howiella sp.]|jgi:hypothetical protein
MADLLDYIEWRGDLSFQTAPFNEIDSLIFCQLAYLNLDGLITPNREAEPIPLPLLADMFANASDHTARLRLGPLISPRTNDLLPAMAGCRRFADTRLSCYVDRVDADAQVQFSALYIDIGNGEAYIAFRGTDDTVVGWKEDFLMSVDTVPSQLEAVEYIRSVAGKSTAPLHIGGHSKGGNLAVYGAAFCPEEIRERIVAVYNNDGPGFEGSVLADPAYKGMIGRVKTFVPQSSVVGMLLGHEEPYTVVHSDQKGLLQHDAFSWQVKRDGFVLLDHVTDQSRFIDHTLKDWIAGMNMEQRGKFIDALFGLLEANDITTLSELSTDRLRRSGSVLKYISGADEETRRLVYRSIQQLLRSARENLNLFHKKAKSV